MQKICIQLKRNRRCQNGDWIIERCDILAVQYIFKVAKFSSKTFAKAVREILNRKEKKTSSSCTFLEVLHAQAIETLRSACKEP